MTCQFGAGNEARTRYLHLGKVALYQMSYARVNSSYYTTVSTVCQHFFSFSKKFFYCAFSGAVIAASSITGTGASSKNSTKPAFSSLG